MIEGVVVKEIKRHPDERGFFSEIVRFDDLGIIPKQESHAYRVTGVSNGWHIHLFHIETFYVVRGVMRLCLKDCRYITSVLVDYPYDKLYKQAVNFVPCETCGEYMEVVLSEYDPKAVVVPAGVAHGYKILEAADIIYTATATYETSQHDEGRIEWNRWPEHNWTRNIEVR